jgi:hypothetical protein
VSLIRSGAVTAIATLFSIVIQMEHRDNGFVSAVQTLGVPVAAIVENNLF